TVEQTISRTQSISQTQIAEPSSKTHDAKGEAERAVTDFLARQVPDLHVSKCSLPDGSVDVMLKGDGYALRLGLSNLCVDASISTAIGPLLDSSSKLFDDVLLADAKGRVVFQNGGSEIISTDLSSLLQGAAQDQAASLNPPSGQTSENKGT